MLGSEDFIHPERKNRRKSESKVYFSPNCILVHTVDVCTHYKEVLMRFIDKNNNPNIEQSLSNLRNDLKLVELARKKSSPKK